MMKQVTKVVSKWRYRFRGRSRILVLIAFVFIFSLSTFVFLQHQHHQHQQQHQQQHQAGYHDHQEKDFFDDEDGDRDPEQRYSYTALVPETCSRPVVDAENLLSKSFQDTNITLICPIDEVILSHLNQVTGQVSLDLQSMENLNIKCYYSFFERKFANDYKLVSHRSSRSGNSSSSSRIGGRKIQQIFPDDGSIQLTAEKNLVNVSCFDGIGDRIHYTTHMYIPEFFKNQTTTTNIKQKASKELNPNILVLVVDSMSQLAFKRLMKQTKHQLDSMGAEYMDYFVTLRGSSYFNLMAMLTGQLLVAREKSSKKISFDNQFKNVLWNLFKQQGYTTGLMWDTPDSGLFHSNAKGFKNPPTDFYPIAFWNQISIRDDGEVLHDNSKIPHETSSNLRDMCYGMNGYKLQIFLDQMLYFVNQNGNNKHRPYFLLAFYSQMMRQNINLLQIADQMFEGFFKKLQKILKNTVLVFVGESGDRKDQYLATSVGRLEERMNLLAIVMTKDVRHRFHNFGSLLTTNSERLVSWLDVHVMLSQFADLSFKEDATRKTLGINPLSEGILSGRSCSNAGIRDEYCVCGPKVYLDVKSDPRPHDVNQIYQSVKRFLNMECARSIDPELKFAYYHVSTELAQQLKDQVTASLVIVNGSQPKTRIYLNLTRDWNQMKPDFHVDSSANFDSNLCL